MAIASNKSLQDVDTLISQLSGLTGLSKGQISDQISSLKIPSFQFDDTILVSPQDFEGVIDAWASQIKTSLRTGEAPASQPTVETPEAEDILDLSALPKPKSSKLKWPKGYEKTVTHLYSKTLSRVLPESPQEQRPYLEAIASKTKEGQRLVDELARAIVKRSKRKLAVDKVKDGLQSKIEEMWKASG